MSVCVGDFLKLLFYQVNVILICSVHLILEGTQREHLVESAKAFRSFARRGS